MGIETKWHKRDREVDLGKVIFASPEEWLIAQKARDRLIAQQLPPFKISRAEWNRNHPDEPLQHSFIVAADGRLGVKGRAKSYKKKGTEENVHEGILGHGSFGVAKLILWENGKLSAVKIERASDDSAEQAIMKHLGLIEFSFQRSLEARSSTRPANQDWIAESKITDKSYKFIDAIDGVSLKSFLTTPQQRLSLLARRQLAIESIEALINLQDQNIVHNDLHYENILIDCDSKVHIIDFGNAKMLKDGTYIATQRHDFGRTDCLAPEIVQQAKVQKDPKKYHIKITSAADVYSLGLIIFKNIFDNLLLPKHLADLKEAMLNPDPKARIKLSTALKIISSNAVTQELIEKQNDMNKPLHRKDADAIEFEGELITPYTLLDDEDWETTDEQEQENVDPQVNESTAKKITSPKRMIFSDPYPKTETEDSTPKIPLPRT